MTETVVCVDIGTSSLKIALIDKRGTIFAHNRVRLLSHDHSDIWLNSFMQALFMTDIPDCSIEAVCISGNGPTLAVDGKILLWNEDFSHTLPEHLAKMPGRFGQPAPAESLFLPRLLLFREKYPDIWNRSPHIYSGPEYLIYQLTGSPVTILPEARYSGAYWTPDMLAACGIPSSKLPPFVPPAFCAGVLKQGIVKLLQKQLSNIRVPEKVKVFCGGPDFITALIGTNTLFPGATCDRAGSSEGINVCTSSPVKVDGVRTLPSVVSPLYNASILIADSGTRFSTYKRSIASGQKTDYPEFVRELLQHPESEGCRILKHIAYEIREGFDLLESSAARAVGQKILSMRASGGQARNPVWTQMKSDVLGIIIEVTACADAELVGGAALAQVGLGEYQTIRQAAEQMVSVTQTYYPDAKKHAAYTREYVEQFSKKHAVAQS